MTALIFFLMQSYRFIYKVMIDELRKIIPELLFILLPLGRHNYYQYLYISNQLKHEAENHQYGYGAGLQ